MTFLSTTSHIAHYTSLMSTWIAFFRGINVGGKTLPMKQLTAALEDAGFADVRTYIQSGNVLFASRRTTAPQLEKRIGKCVAKRFHFEPRALVLSADELAQAAAANPFREADANPKSLHLFFLARTPPSPDIEGLHRVKATTEKFELKGKVFYLHTPAGFGVSKLAERAERLLGVEATARNWRTVCTVLDMANEVVIDDRKPTKAVSRAASASKPHGK
jgi:uncharacterized protein (DUF1697 family)